MKFDDLRVANAAKELEFKDISSEAWREYVYPNGQRLRYEAPVALAVSKSGGHRLLTEDGVSHVIVAGFVAVDFLVKDGAPHFVA
jgi:hypothetical protein